MTIVPHLEPAAELRVRRVRFEFPDDFDPDWSPLLPEFAASANAVSLLMPSVEPYVVKAVRSAIPDLDDELAARALDFARQETGHHREHERLNRLVEARYPGLRRIDGWMRRTFDWLWRTRSREFHLAFAAGAETVAYTAARWVERRMGTLFRGADPLAATLFLWHLGEEVEHKSVAHDVHRAICGSRRRYASGMLSAFALLAAFTVMGTTVTLWSSRRIWRPSTWWHLTTWSFSFVFTALPTMLGSALGGHHPSQLTDPAWYSLWLRGYDPLTETMPVWQPPGRST
jgi:predicted metal-dependent hydrolase